MQETGVKTEYSCTWYTHTHCVIKWGSGLVPPSAAASLRRLTLSALRPLSQTHTENNHESRQDMNPNTHQGVFLSLHQKKKDERDRTLSDPACKSS